MASQQYNNDDGRLRGHKGVARRLRLWAIHPHCAMCGKLTDYGKNALHPFHLDHKLALDNGGLDEDDNLQVLCVEPCHRKKTAKDLGIRYVQPIGDDGFPKE